MAFLQQVLDVSSENILFVLLLAMTMLIMLTALTLMNNKLRLMESDLQSLKKDQGLINSELEMVASMKAVDEPHAKQK